ncbi:MAG TPA: PAS domain S-box protein [Candidatus Eisenbacteria bacterium]|jgi:PAS domain S-box-containing protein|nr:PAS domain S-box protein [Candidatus Eisenbacteria bacterium]
MNESPPGEAIRSRSAFQPEVFGLLFEAHPHALLVLDPTTWKILAANPAAGELLGRGLPDLVGTTIGDLKGGKVTPGMHRGPGVSEKDICRGGIWRFPRPNAADALVEIVSTEIEVSGSPALLVDACDVTERETKAHRLREHDELLSVAIESLPGCFVAMDQFGMIIEFNHAAEKVFKRSRREVINRDMAETLIPPELRERHRRSLAHYLETGERHVIERPVEMRALRADGTTFWAEIHVSVAHHPSGKTAFVAHIVDLTETKRQQREIAVSQAIGRAIGEDNSVSDTTVDVLKAVGEYGNWDVALAWMLDEAGETLRFAEAWLGRKDVASFVKRSRELSFTIGKGLPGRVWELRRPHWVTDISANPNFPRSRAAIESQLTSGFALPVRADARILGVIEFFSRERREPDDEMNATFASVGLRLGNFIERKVQAEKLREANDMLRALLRASPLAIIQVDRDFIVRFWNAAAERMFGWSEREMLGRPYQVVVPAEKRNEFRKLCERLFTGEELKSVDTWRKHKDGSRVDIHLSVAPLRDKDGQITMMLGVISESPKPQPPGPRMQRPPS